MFHSSRSATIITATIQLTVPCCTTHTTTVSHSYSTKRKVIEKETRPPTGQLTHNSQIDYKTVNLTMATIIQTEEPIHEVHIDGLVRLRKYDDVHDVFVHFILLSCDMIATTY